MKCDIYNCNIYESQKYIKHKWIPIIIFCINQDIKKFNDLLNSINYISNAQLANSLEKLKQNNIISNEEGEYKLTDKGHQLSQIIDLMAKFEG